LGGLVELIVTANKSNLPLLFLFVVWQTAVIVLIAHALAASPTESI
jgi:hypothetical protein